MRLVLVLISLQFTLLGTGVFAASPSLTQFEGRYRYAEGRSGTNYSESTCPLSTIQVKVKSENGLTDVELYSVDENTGAESMLDPDNYSFRSVDSPKLTNRVWMKNVYGLYERETVSYDCKTQPDGTIYKEQKITSRLLGVPFVGSSSVAVTTLKQENGVLNYTRKITGSLVSECHYVQVTE